MSSETNKERLDQNNAKISELIELVKSKGASEKSNIDATDPVALYKAERNPKWLNMMASGYGENYEEMKTYYDTHDNEIRLLFHLVPPKDNLLALDCTVSSGTFAVTIKKGDGSAEMIVPTSGTTKIELNLDYNDYGDEFDMVDGVVGTGIRQALIIIKPLTEGATINTFIPTFHSLKTSPSNFSSWNIKEFMGKCTTLTSIKMGNSNDVMATPALNYFTLFGENAITNAQYLFANCKSLIAILQLYTEKITRGVYMFYNTNCIRATSPLNFISLTSADNMFMSSGITKINLVNAINISNANYMFAYCDALSEFPIKSFKPNTSVLYTLNYCISLIRILDFNLQSLGSGSNTLFKDLYSLRQLTFSPITEEYAGVDISINNCSLGYQALIDLFNSLPTITTNHTLTVTNNVGSSELTEDDIAIATAKNWTVVYQ